MYKILQNSPASAAIQTGEGAYFVGTRPSETEHASLFEQTMGMCFAGIQARGTLLGIAVSIEASPETTTALVLDVPLLGSSDPL